MKAAGMVTSVREELLQRFPGSRGRGAAIELATDGVRVRMQILTMNEFARPALVAAEDAWLPAPVLVVPTIELDGFSLRLVPKRREVARVPRDASPDELVLMIPKALNPDELAVHSDDPGFASAWLDVVTLGALARTLGVQVHPDLFAQVATVTGCQADVIDGAVLVRPATLAPDHLAACARAAALLATRPQRLGAELAATFERLGAVVTGDRWDLGRDFVAVIERGGATLRIDHTRLLPGEPAEAAHLRTRIRARHAGPPNREPLDRRLRPLQALITAARPGTIDDDGDEILLLWAGLIRAADRLAPAIELVARLAGGGVATGPYR